VAFDALLGQNRVQLGKRMHVVLMIDKLDLRVPTMTPLRPLFAELVYARTHGKRIPRATSSTYYNHVFDLRQYRADAILRYGAKFGRDRANKLELLEVGNKHFNMLEERIASIFDVDPGDLGVMRIDLAVDVDGIPVSWFRHHSRVPYKQFSREVGKMTVEFSEAVKGEIQTLYFGRSPNCFRIYNRVAERTAQYLKDNAAVIRLHIGRGRNVSEILGFAGLELTSCIGSGTHITIPSFQERYGISPDALCTRIERQIGGGRVPPELDRVWKLRRNLPEFNPFAHDPKDDTLERIHAKAC